MRKLTKEILIELGYKPYTWEIDSIMFDTELDEWVHEKETTWTKNGLTIHQNMYSTEPDFSFADRVRDDGSFKSGWVIKTDEQLKLLEKALINNI